MASRNYIPTILADRQLWFQNFADYIAANFLAVGLVQSDADVISLANLNFQTAYTQSQTAQTRSPVTVANLVTQNNAMNSVARQYATLINSNAAVTDAQRAALQITIRTVPPFGRISAPATWPVLGIRSIGPLLHILTYRDSSYPSESKVRAKPFGVASLQLFQHVGATPPANPAASIFLGNFTRLPISVDLDGANVGQTAFYYARWISARGLEGPLVGPTVATVANAAG